MDLASNVHSSLPTDLRTYARLLEKKENEELEALSLTPSESQSSDDESQPDWSTPQRIQETMFTQTHSQLTALFGCQQHVQPPVENMMGMSPFTKAKFRHRSDSKDFGHMKAIRHTGSPTQDYKKYDSLLEDAKKRDRKWTCDDFEKGRLLGTGRFARVWLAREKSSGYIVVLKAIQKAKVRKYHAEKALRNEIEVQSHLDHPNILRLYTFFHDTTHIYLVLEYAMMGDLFTYLRENDIDMEIIALYIYEISNALQYMHANLITHRDLKPENIFINHLGQIKIADFGWSCHSHKKCQVLIVGTTQYMAPEMLLGKGYTTAADVWSLGILFYEMLTGDIPFNGGSYDEISQLILEGKYSPPDNCTAPGAVDLLRKLLQSDPAKRITLEEVLQHFWITESLEKLEQADNSK